MGKTEFYITDGERFIRQDINGKYKCVTNCSLADVWDNRKVASAILNNSIPCAWRKSFYVAKYINGEFEKYSLTGEEKEEYIKEASQQRKNQSYTLDLYSFDEDKEAGNIIRGYADVLIGLENTENLHCALQNELTTLEMMREDLKHYCLRKRLGTVDSYKFKKLENEVILRRISVKTQLELLYKINKYRKDIVPIVKDICQTIEDIRNKRYKPRVLFDLFESDNLDIEIFALKGDDYV